MVVDAFRDGQATAVLCSGGLDSVVLVAHEARSAPVLPTYVAVGFAWEAEERTRLDAVLAALDRSRILPRRVLALPMEDVYPATHWAMRGTPPAYDTDDRDVYIVGRNVSLLAKAGICCAQLGLRRLAIGPLAGNPFPDATPAFFDAMARALTLGLDAEIRVEAPFAGMRKADVIRLGARLGVPLELTLSCMNPTGGRHCGACSKCRERRDAFREAGVEDGTDYGGTGFDRGRS
jgi:7-cyano-7-deazaguanine synthase